MNKRTILTGVFVVAFVLLCCSARANASSQPYLNGHGINFGTGNKYVSETDISLDGPVRLTFSRTYNSQSTVSGVLGYGWSASFTEKLIDATSTITLVRSDGRNVRFAANPDGSFTSALGASETITRITGGFQLTKANQEVHTYESQGRLTTIAYANGTGLTYAYTGDQVASITDSLGRTLTFTYTGDYLTNLATPAGNVTYSYDGNGNLTAVTRPGIEIQTYEYAPSGDNHNLIGIIDATGVRLQNLTYDSSDRVVTSSLAGNTDSVTIGYPSLLTRTVTDAQNVVSTYELDVQQGVARVKSFTGPGCSSCGLDTGSSYLYNSHQQVSSMTDANGIITAYTYDTKGNRLTETEASGAPLARTTTTTYTTNNQPATISVPSVSNPGQQMVTTLTYDAQGNLLSRRRAGYSGATAISEVTNYTYNAMGQLLTVDGPRADVNDTLTLAYYPNDPSQGNNRAQLHTVTDALSQTTTYEDYTPLGKPGTITDSTGLITTLTYNFRGDVLTRTTGGLTTAYSYDPAGRLQTVTLPGSRTIIYTYANNRVASITDAQGNAITYSYDAAGRQTGRHIHDPGNVLTFTLGLSYDQAGNLSKRTYADNAEEQIAYDPVRNLVQATNPLGTVTEYSYDGLRRMLTQGMAGQVVATLAYDSRDNVTSVTDARNHVTTSAYDDFGNVRSVSAPDTGATISAFDAAGNLLTRTNARNQTISLTHDALNRPLRLSYPGAARDLAFTYGAGGRLSAVQEEESSRSFSYNSLGQLTAETRTLGTVTATIGYGYNASTGELASMTYPSGRVVSFAHNAAGQITGIQVDGVPLASSIEYLPFGPVKRATLGTLSLGRSYDRRYQVSRIQAGPLDYTYTRDKAGQVLAVTNLPSPTTADITETAAIEGDSNRITGLTGATAKSYSYDATGNIIIDGTLAYTWDALNRLVKVEQAGAVVATYGYDSQNRRIRKSVGDRTIHYHYDMNNLLIAETLADGTPLRDYFYLGGEPLALREYKTNPGTYYFLNDHLGTPQQLVKPDGTVVWKAAYLPYGEAQIQHGTVTNNLRFPGQYFDSETGLHYNWHRFYDPSTGGYISADPIGLRGGMNLYTYVGGNPVNWFDPNALTKIDVDTAGGIMTVDPEKSGEPPYKMPITSGRGECTNEPKCSDQENAGPIPLGNYTANIDDISDPSLIGDIARNARGDWGDWRVPVKPSPGIDTKGRGGFFLHGGRISGSAGCIDFGGGRFGDPSTDKLKKDILNDPDGIVPITVH